MLPLHPSESPVQKRNAKMRSGPRRGLLLNRGKRLLSVGNGFVAVPHANVPPQHFHKHLDASLPDPHRMRQLLVWCFRRVLDNEQNDPNHMPLLAVDASTASGIARQVKQELVADLVAGTISTSWYNRDDETTGSPVMPEVPNQQNLNNATNIAKYLQVLTELRQERAEWERCIAEAETEAEQFATLVGAEAAEAATTAHPTVAAAVQQAHEAVARVEPAADEFYRGIHALQSTARAVEQATHNNTRRLDRMVRQTLGSGDGALPADTTQQLLQGLSRVVRRG